jgi:hypothetical protein
MWACRARASVLPYEVRLFGPLQHEPEARAAEKRGDYAQAAALFAQAGLLEEAARVTILRGDAEKRHTARMRHYARAASLVPEGSSMHRSARTKRALVLVAIASEGPATAAARRDLASAARELESLGEHELAADAYGRAEDAASQLHALERAGNVDAVEALLALDNERHRAARVRRRESDEFAALLTSGRRREAVAIARASTDEALQERGNSIASRRLVGCEAHVVVDGQAWRLLLGDSVVVGRAPNGSPDGDRVATLAVASAALSRNHLGIFRRGDDVVVRDLGSRHGTEIRGLALGGEFTVGEGVELRLGRSLAIALKPATEFAGGVAIILGSSRYLAPLGPARLGIGRWRIERGPDDWVELATDDEPPAFGGSIRWAPRVTLLAGDAIAQARGGAPAITF